MEEIKIDWIPVTERIPNIDREYLVYSSVFGLVITVPKYFEVVRAKYWTDATFCIPANEE